MSRPMASRRPYLRPLYAVVIILLVCLVSCAVEPCDGHSCDAEVVDVQ